MENRNVEDAIIGLVKPDIKLKIACCSKTNEFNWALEEIDRLGSGTEL